MVPKLNDSISSTMVVHAFNPRTQMAEAEGSLSSRPRWLYRGQPELRRETVSENKTEPNQDKRD